ncbi:High potential iron-sulfur protein [Thioalkalivibrio denitrificans]|uniref:High-potential iron-sulfur protein n=1 Tax=Thioalkalivibrio denitrificans TaxID=108003 RepID=A0A1V3NEW0_9GAMM|nr:high-potential iron-sulfur protein [Thioalkalivibrio denitrificans]OOG23637.1 High potential iron-sulfur protein [Thioalkalivibrio denitrificans]
MHDRKTNLTRRRLLRAGIASLAAVPAAPLIFSPAFAKERLSEDNPQAQALHYRHDVADVDHADYEEGQKCANCQLYTDPDAADWGPCSAFPGHLVSANGWCTAWVPRG